MPELPEVEIVRRGLEPVMTGVRIVRLEQRRPDLRFPLPRGFAAAVEGKTVTAIERRAKYLLLSLSGGTVLLAHLGMTGRFSVARRGEARSREIGSFEYDTGAAAPHDHIVFHLKGGTRVTYNDPRRFGFMLLLDGPELETHPLLRHLGAEPLGPDFTPAYLAERASGRRADVKALLMNQSIVAGLGNIYVCEALFRAGLSPRRRAATLATRTGKPTPRTEALVAAIRSVLEAAIAAGGSTLRDYRQADGTSGGFQHSHWVYGREGRPCRRPGCGGTVKRIVQAGRATFYCPRCQT